MAAISSIALAGPDAQGILDKVFQEGCAEAWSGSDTINSTFHGSIIDGERVVDEVVVGCESENEFAIHCHGNPLLVEQIVKLLQSHGAALMDAEHFAIQRCQRESKNAIEVEAKLAMQKSATLLGVKILQSQIDDGLSKWARETLDAADSLCVDDIQKGCEQILRHSKIARRIIEGVRIVIAGPPNSGKSTLLNCLVGTKQVIVSNTAGTTRDWVSATGQVGPIRAEFIDTAGLDDALAGADAIEENAQQITKELLSACDAVLYVVSVLGPQSSAPSDYGRPVVCVYNKCDLFQENKDTRIQEPGAVFVSAKYNEGIDVLAGEIMAALGVDGFDVAAPVAFTQRQREMISAVAAAPAHARELLPELIDGSS